jgi:uncharacterized protein (UPF0261 family)
MGGRAFEDLTSQGRFTCVLDLATQEVGNHLFGSSMSAGADRLTNAGRSGTPQIIAPGCHDLVDVAGWAPISGRWEGYDRHAHNRLVSSIVLTNDDRISVAHTHAEKLNIARGKTAFVMPMGGSHEWDRFGAPLHNPEGPKIFATALRSKLSNHVEWHETQSHINDDVFCKIVLDIFDRWFKN